MRFFRLLLGLALPAVLLGCVGTIPVARAPEAIAEAFESAVADDPALRNAVLSIDTPRLGISWSGAMIRNEAGETSAASADRPFFTASTGKMFTATAIALLVEQGLLDYDDRLVDLLDPGVTEGLHVMDGVDRTGEIRIRHLLSHSSGLPDPFTEAGSDGATFLDLLLADPMRFWRPEEVVALSKHGWTPHFAPGEGFRYSDVNYQLLGLILEKVTGEDLQSAYRRLIWDPIGMTHTWLYIRSEPASELPLLRAYREDVDLTDYRCLSAVWADGGCATTASDLALFVRALFAGNLVRPETLATMQDWKPYGMDGIDYGFGLMRFRLADLSVFLRGFPVLIGHAGASGSFAYYCPDYDAVIVGSFNLMSYEQRHINALLPVLQILMRVAG